MDAIYIPQLTTAPERTAVVEFEEFLPDLETLTPVKGALRVRHQGNYLETSSQAETIITLTCHRCLQHYNHRLSIQVSELIWLAEPPNQVELSETEVAFEDLVETLSPQGFFSPGDWLYQQLCLEIPQQQLCDNQCLGIPLNNTNRVSSSLDRRWQSLEALKHQFPS